MNSPVCNAGQRSNALAAYRVVGAGSQIYTSISFLQPDTPTPKGVQCQ